MLRPGLCSVTFRQLSAESIIELAVEARLQGIEWGSDVHLPADDPTNAERLRDRTLAAGLELPSYGSYYRLGESDPHPFERYVETARVLGVPVIRVWPGRGGSAATAPPRRRELVDDARRIADLAARHGLVVATEYHSHSLTDSVESARRLMQEVDRENFRSYWQVPLGAPPPVAAEELRAMAPWLVNIHCFNWLVNPRDQRPLAEARDAWHRYLGIADELERPIWVLLEFVRGGEPEQLRADAATLRLLLRELRTEA